MSQVRVIYTGKGKAQVLLPNGTDISPFLRNLEITIDGGCCTARGAVFFADCVLGDPLPVIDPSMIPEAH